MIKVKNNFFVAQESVNDCGFATLAMIFKLNNIKFSDNTLKCELNKNEKGISAYNIIKVSKKYGLDAEGYKNYKIKSSELPLIAHVINENKTQHFVVVLKINNNYILVADPSCGIIKMDKTDFDKKYTGISIVFSKRYSFFGILLKNKKLVILMVFLSLLIALFSIVFSYLLSLTLKMIEVNSSISLIIKVLMLFLFIGILKEYLILFKSKIFLKFQLLIDKSITLPTIEKLLNLPYEFYQDNGSGELISKVNDLSSVKQMLFSVVEVLFVNLIVILLSLFLLTFIDVYLLVINGLFILLLYFINNKFLKENLYKTYDLQIKNDNLNNVMTDLFHHILQIKNLVKEKYAYNKIKNTYEDVIMNYKDIQLSYQKKEYKTSLIMVLVNIVIIFLVIVQKFSISKIIFITSLESLFINSAFEIFKLQPLYFDFKSCYLRLYNILNRRVNKIDDTLIDIKHIRFDNVFYKYDDKLILKGVCLEIKNGSWSMITGPSGSGKSTIFKLLNKQIKGPYNDIFINNKSLDEIDNIRNIITYVDQKTGVLNASLYENITLGKADFKKACKVALVDELIKENNISYEYVIDNISSNLSGGQIQKIVIAQTLCSASQVIIFDETTSELDIKTERRILKNIKHAYPEKTIILITHRDKNFDLFDNVIFCLDGKMITKRRKCEKIK